MILIFMRHGIAEEAGPEQQDAARRLTERGRKKLIEALPGLRLLLESSGRTTIWSSPLRRAAETAELLASALSEEPVCHVEAIATGNWGSVFSQLTRIDSKQLLLLIGHEPNLGIWTEEICGVCLPFKKGAAAAIKLDLKENGKGELLWFVQPGIMRQLNHGVKKD